jgi:creatinine amidohydrolase/Fe(II)-dependent formamide hydrolase-like protein
MLHYAPEHVKMDQAKPTRIRRSIFSRSGSIFFTNPWHLYTVNTGIGDPTKASAEKGEKMNAAAVDRLAQALKELSEAPMDDLFPYTD